MSTIHRDFFAEAVSGNNQVDQLIATLYGISDSSPDCYLAINLQWPVFDLPLEPVKYLVSFHTEQIDCFWVVAQAKRVYPKNLMLLYDGELDGFPWPDNVIPVRWITWHLQIQQLMDQFGIAKDPAPPQFKISSLSYRVTQYKRFVTAWLLKNIDHNDLILSWHNKLGKQEDLHDHPQVDWLTGLNLDIDRTMLNWEKSEFVNQPMANGDWSLAAYKNAAINFNNETWHYSLTMVDEHLCLYPGPYLTEKTWKPLLAGQACFHVGQYRAIESLERLGLDMNFGWSTSYDLVPGDIDRIGELFRCAECLRNRTTADTFEISRPAVLYNLKCISSGEFSYQCEQINLESFRQIRDFVC